MRRGHLDGLEAFIAVAETNSFSAAAVRLGISPSAVSHAIRALEQRLTLALFNRNTRSVSLTEIGARYFERVLPAMRDLNAATGELSEESLHPAGLLRLNVPRSGYMIALQPILKRFTEAYPAINLEIVIENGLADIVGRGFDAGIRFGDLVERDMIAVKIGPPLTAHLVAAPDYLVRHGTPAHPRELLEHSCLCFRHDTSGQVERWELAKGEEKMELSVTGRLITNDSAALVQSALDGLGIAYMINGYIERFIADGRLVRLFAEWSPPLAPLTLYYANRRLVPLKLRALIDFLQKGPNLLPATDSCLVPVFSGAGLG